MTESGSIPGPQPEVDVASLRGGDLGRCPLCSGTVSFNEPFVHLGGLEVHLRCALAARERVGYRESVDLN